MVKVPLRPLVPQLCSTSAKLNGADFQARQHTAARAKQARVAALRFQRRIRQWNIRTFSGGTSPVLNVCGLAFPNSTVRADLEFA